MSSDSVASTLRRVARQAGLAEGVLRSDLPELLGMPSFIQPSLVKHWERVLGRSRHLLATLPPPSGPRVALITTVGKGVNNPGYAAVLAYALRLRGADPFLVYCNGVLAGCEHATSAYLSPEEFIERGPRRLCSGCYQPGEMLYRRLELPAYSLSEFLSAEALEAVERFVRDLPREQYYTFSYRGMPLGFEVEATIVRFFYNFAPDDRELTWRVAQRMVRGAVMMAEAVSRMIDRYQPDIVMPHYGSYASRGTAALAAQAKARRVVTWFRGYVEEAMMLGEGDNGYKELGRRSQGPWETIELTPENEQALEQMLQAKRHVSTLRVPRRNPVHDSTELLRQLQLDPKRPILALFTNVGYDSKAFYHTSLYPTVLSWIYDSIELVRNRPMQLVIRIHPAELWALSLKLRGPIPEPVVDQIRKQFPVLPDNVRVIPPESRLSSYALGAVSTAALVYGSLMGLELAAQGKPVIVAGRGAYWQKGFTYDVHSREDYAAFLDRLQELAQPDSARTVAARRFAHYFYFLRQIPFQAWNQHHHAGLRLKPWWKAFRSLADLQPGRDPNLDALCDQVLTGQEALAQGWPA